VFVKLAAGKPWALTFWSADTGQQAREPLPLAANEHGILSQNGDAVVCFSLDPHEIPYEKQPRQIDEWRVRLVELRESTPPGPSVRLVVGSIPTLSPDGRTVLTFDGKNTRRFCDLATGEVFGTPLVHDSPILYSGYFPDGKYIWTQDQTGTTHFWDAQTGAAFGAPIKWGTGGTIRIGRYPPGGPDGYMVITTDIEAGGRTWYIPSTGAKSRTVPIHGGDSVQLSPDRRFAIWGTGPGQAQLRESVSFTPIGLPLNHIGGITGICFSPDGRKILTGGTGVIAWETPTEKNSRSIPLEHPQGVHALAFSTDGTRLITGGTDNTARLWDVRSGKMVRELQFPEAVRNVVRLDDDTIITAAGPPPPFGASAMPLTFPPEAAKPPGPWEFRRWHVKDNRDLTEVSPRFVYPDRVDRVLLVPGTTAILTASDTAGVGVWYCDLDTPGTRSRWAAETHESPLLCVGRATVAGKVLAIHRDGRVWVRNPKSGWGGVEPVVRCGNDVLAAAFSADGAYLMTCHRDSAARVWDTRTGRRVTSFTGAPSVSRVAVSHDGTTAMTGGWDGLVRLWDARFGYPIGPGFRHAGPITECAFAPDGTTVATAGSSGFLGQAGHPKAVVWSVPEPIAGQPTDVQKAMQWRTAQHLDASGNVRPLLTRR
jgi:WD40 repeat protein